MEQKGEQKKDAKQSGGVLGDTSKGVRYLMDGGGEGSLRLAFELGKGFLDSAKTPRMARPLFLLNEKSFFYSVITCPAASGLADTALLLFCLDFLNIILFQ